MDPGNKCRDDIAHFTSPTSRRYRSAPGWISSRLGAAEAVLAAVVYVSVMLGRRRATSPAAQVGAL